MTDLEKLVEMLSGVQAGGVALDHEALKANAVQNEEVAEYLIAHGVTVRERQRPLTVEEIKKLPEVVYIECSFFVKMHAALPFDLQTNVVPCVVLQMVDGFEHFRIDKYGKTWRCWAEKPTEEERKAAEWYD